MTQVSHKQISKLVCSLPERWIGCSQPTQVKQNRWDEQLPSTKYITREEQNKQRLARREGNVIFIYRFTLHSFHPSIYNDITFIIFLLCFSIIYFLSLLPSFYYAFIVLSLFICLLPFFLSSFLSFCLF